MGDRKDLEKSDWLRNLGMCVLAHLQGLQGLGGSSFSKGDRQERGW